MSELYLKHILPVVINFLELQPPGPFNPNNREKTTHVHLHIF